MKNVYYLHKLNKQVINYLFNIERKYYSGHERFIFVLLLYSDFHKIYKLILRIGYLKNIYMTAIFKNNIIMNLMLNNRS